MCSASMAYPLSVLLATILIWFYYDDYHDDDEGNSYCYDLRADAFGPG